MAILDIILLLCFIPAVVSGLTHGFINQAFGFIGLIIGIWGAFHFSSFISIWLSQYVTLSKQMLHIICFIFVAVVLAMLLCLVGRMLTGVLHALTFGIANRLLGLLFGLLKMALELGLIIICVEWLNGIIHFMKPDFTAGATVYNGLRNFAEAVFPYLKTLVTGING